MTIEEHCVEDHGAGVDDLDDCVDAHANADDLI